MATFSGWPVDIPSGRVDAVADSEQRRENVEPENPLAPPPRRGRLTRNPNILGVAVVVVLAVVAVVVILAIR